MGKRVIGPFEPQPRPAVPAFPVREIDRLLRGDGSSLRGD